MTCTVLKYLCIGGEIGGERVRIGIFLENNGDDRRL